MSTIKICDLVPAGYELFSDPENFMRDLSGLEFSSTQGGTATLLTITHTQTSITLCEQKFSYTFAEIDPETKLLG